MVNQFVLNVGHFRLLTVRVCLAQIHVLTCGSLMATNGGCGSELVPEGRTVERR